MTKIYDGKKIEFTNGLSGNVIVDGQNVGMFANLIIKKIVSQKTYNFIVADVKSMDNTIPDNVIEGYTQLKAAYADVSRYARELEESYESCIGPNPVVVTPETVAVKYPKAAAYVEAENYSRACNYDKANAGEKAMKRIIFGEDYQLVIAEMKAEWHKTAEQAVLNN